jgi:hypothetical protein
MACIKAVSFFGNGQFASEFAVSPHRFNGFAKVLLVNIFSVKEILRNGAAKPNG